MNRINKFLFGGRKAYEVLTSAEAFKIAGTHYRCGRGMLTIRDNWSKVATFREFKSIVEKS